jgi:DtxR family Mn-dependent transcriptional regulator
VTEMIDTTEMYLRTILELEEEGIVPLRARIAERLGHSGPTVSQTVGRMERDGLLAVVGDRHLELSERGRLAATRVMRKHRLAERLLVDVIGLDWDLAHDEACRWEHVISDEVERRILALLGQDAADAPESPYGNPIPGLDELVGGDRDTPDFLEGVVALAEIVEGTDAVGLLVRTRRIGEPVQAEHAALSLLTVAGLVPGQISRVWLQEEQIRARREDGGGAEPVVLPRSVANHVFVVPGR